jgi:DNA-binding MarR family transcriptional regulator
MDPEVSDSHLMVMHHLATYRRMSNNNGYDGRFETTQNGIAEAIGRARSFISRLTADLESLGYIESGNLHVPGRRRRVLNYWLTPEGYRYLGNQA